MRLFDFGEMNKELTGEQASKTIEKCDNMFYVNEAEINHILEEYAANIQL